MTELINSSTSRGKARRSFEYNARFDVTKRTADGKEQIVLGGAIFEESASEDVRSFSIEKHRVREIQTIIRHRHGHEIPDPRGTDDEEICTNYLVAVAATKSSDFEKWASVWAAWADKVTLSKIIESVDWRKWQHGADDVAKLLCVTNAERIALGLRTIGACDVSKRERTNAAKQRKKANDRARQEAKRRAAGMVKRSDRNAFTIAVTKPWQAEGVSRATWYRRQKQDAVRRETAVSRIEMTSSSYTSASDTRVSSEKEASEDKRSTTTQTLNAPAGEGEAEAWGQGTKFLAGVGSAHEETARHVGARARDHFIFRRKGFTHDHCVPG